MWQIDKCLTSNWISYFSSRAPDCTPACPSPPRHSCDSCWALFSKPHGNKDFGNMTEIWLQLADISLWHVKIVCFSSPLLPVIFLWPHINPRVCQPSIIPTSDTKHLRWENKALSDAVGKWQDQSAFSTSSIASTFSQHNVFMISKFQLMI